MATVVVEMTGDEAKLVASMRRVLEQQEKMTPEARKLAQESRKLEAEQARVSKVYEGQIKSLDLQVIAIEKGTAAAAEMKAIQEGLSKEQAETIRKRHEELEATKAMVADQQKLKSLYNEQVSKLELEAVAIKKGVGAAAEMKAIQQGLTRSEAEKIGSLTHELELQRKIKKEQEDQESSGNRITNNVASLAAGYLSIGSVVSTVSDQMREQIKLQEESLRLTLETAKAQSGASQNLTGLSSEDKAKALASANTIQAKTGFSDKNEILNAIGSSYGITGDLGKTTSAIEAAIPLAAQSPENLKELTRSSLSVQRMTGVNSIEDSLGFLQNAAGASFVDSNAAVAKNLTPILATAVAGAPTQDAKEASSQAAAIFGKVTQDKQDPLGDTSRVAADKFIRTLASVSQTITEEVTKLDEQIAPLADRKRITDTEKAQLSRADINITEKQRIADQMGSRTDYKAIDARADLEEAKANKVKLLETITLNDLESKKLAKLQEQRQGLSSVKDSGTIFGRMEAAQSNTALRELVLEKLGNDESRTVYEGLLKKDNQAGLIESARSVQFDRKAYDQQVTEERSLTPELAIATVANKAEGLKQAETATFDRSSAALIRNTVNTALENNRLPGLSGVLEKAVENTSSMLGLESFQSRDPNKMIDQGILRLRGQQEDLRGGGVFTGPSKQDLQSVSNLETSIQLLEEMRAMRIEQEKNNALMIEQNRIQMENGKKPPVPANPAAPAPVVIRNQANQKPVVGAQ